MATNTKRIDSKFQVEAKSVPYGDEPSGISVRIVKTSNNDPIPDDEPLFLIRARDRLALPLLRIYKELSLVGGCNQYHLDLLYEAINNFVDFKATHADRMKQPSITMGK